MKQVATILIVGLLFFCSSANATFYAISHMVVDTERNLMWQQINDGIGRTHSDSMLAAEAFSLNGYDDWRLPTWDELISIVDNRFWPTINPLFVCETQINNLYFWTSTPVPAQPGDFFTVVFSSGNGSYASGGSKYLSRFLRTIPTQQPEPEPTPDPIPEPTAMMLLGSGFIGLFRFSS